MQRGRPRKAGTIRNPTYVPVSIRRKEALEQQRVSLRSQRQKENRQQQIGDFFAQFVPESLENWYDSASISPFESKKIITSCGLESVGFLQSLALNESVFILNAGSVGGLSFSATGEWLAIGGCINDDAILSIWRIPGTPKLSQVVIGPNWGFVHDLKWLFGCLVVVSCGDGVVRVLALDLESSGCKRVVRVLADSVTGGPIYTRLCASVSATKYHYTAVPLVRPLLAASRADGFVTLFALPTLSQGTDKLLVVSHVAMHQGIANDIAWLGNLVVSVGSDGRVMALDHRDVSSPWPLCGRHQGPLTSCCVAQKLWYCDNENWVRPAYAFGNRIMRYRHASQIWALRANDKGSYLVSCSSDGCVRTMNVDTNMLRPKKKVSGKATAPLLYRLRRLQNNTQEAYYYSNEALPVDFDKDTLKLQVWEFDTLEGITAAAWGMLTSAADPIDVELYFEDMAAEMPMLLATGGACGLVRIDFKRTDKDI